MTDNPDLPDKSAEPATTRGGPDRPRAPDVYGSDATPATTRGAPGGGVEAATIPPAPGPRTPNPDPKSADIAADDAGASARTETPQARP